MTSFNWNIGQWNLSVSYQCNQSTENLEINGGDDVDDELIEPRPTRHDVLKAVSTIKKYIDELDDPVSRKMEEILGPFNQQLHFEETKNMKDTVSTNHFLKNDSLTASL